MSLVRMNIARRRALTELNHFYYGWIVRKDYEDDVLSAYCRHGLRFAAEYARKNNMLYRPLPEWNDNFEPEYRAYN